jgi:hypothetical protein
MIADALRRAAEAELRVRRRLRDTCRLARSWRICWRGFPESDVVQGAAPGR